MYNTLFLRSTEQTRDGLFPDRDQLFADVRAYTGREGHVNADL